MVDTLAIISLQLWARYTIQSIPMFTTNERQYASRSCNSVTVCCPAPRFAQRPCLDDSNSDFMLNLDDKSFRPWIQFAVFCFWCPHFMQLGTFWDWYYFFRNQYELWVETLYTSSFIHFSRIGNDPSHTHIHTIFTMFIRHRNLLVATFRHRNLLCNPAVCLAKVEARTCSSTINLPQCAEIACLGRVSSLPWTLTRNSENLVW